MTEEKLVSVVVPVHNSEQTIRRCVDSILHQNYENVEIILVENGSSDASYEICCQYEKDYPAKVRAFSQDTKGPSPARNRGIQEARGEYLQFVDADDYCDEKMTALLVENLEKTDADLCICGYYEIRGDQKEAVALAKPFTCQMREIMTYVPHFFSEFWSNSPWNKLYRMKYVKPCFEAEHFMGEDLFFNLQYYAQIQKVTGIAECPYRYVRDAEDSLTANKELHSVDTKKEIFSRSAAFAEKYLDGTSGVTDCANTCMRPLINRLVSLVKKGKQSSVQYQNLVNALMEEEQFRRAAHLAKLPTWKMQLFCFLITRKQRGILNIFLRFGIKGNK